MGKTEKGAVWLDPQRTSPYEYYQFWINTDDRDVKRFLALFTFLPMEEIQEKYWKLEGADLRKAKEALAYEATKIVHGEEEAEKAKSDSRAVFSISVSGSLGLTGDSIPTTSIEKEKFIKGIPIFKLFETTGLSSSSSEARRLIEQGGGYLNNKKVSKFDFLVTLDDFGEKDEILLRAGKKKFRRIKVLDKK
jgi:tyrosyl-tRNA synthetase